MSFHVVPSISIAYGRLVSNARPPYSNGHVKSPNPLALVWHWIAEGAHRIHVEELSDPSRLNLAPTLPALLLGCHSIHNAIQVGGGIRDARTASLLTTHGADTLVLGRSLCDPVEFSRILDVVPGPQIMVALKMDAELNPFTSESLDVARQSGVRRVLLGGPWQAPSIFPSQRRTIRQFQEEGFEVWIAGGIRYRDTVLTLKDLGVSGVIIGKAFYDGDLCYTDLQSLETS